MVNVSNVIHTCVWGAPNEHTAPTATSMVGLGIDSSIDVVGLLLGCKNFKTTYIKILI
jgi:hypothetical protein